MIELWEDGREPWRVRVTLGVSVREIETKEVSKRSLNCLLNLF